LILFFAVTPDEVSIKSAVLISSVKIYISLLTLITIQTILQYFFGELNLFNLFMGEVRSYQFFCKPFSAQLPKFSGSEFKRSAKVL
jgi:hypothetical protein